MLCVAFPPYHFSVSPLTENNSCSCFANLTTWVTLAVPPLLSRDFHCLASELMVLPCLFSLLQLKMGIFRPEMLLDMLVYGVFGAVRPLGLV